MKKVLVFAALTAAASTASAYDAHFGDNPDLYASPWVEHRAGGPTGNPWNGEGDLYGSFLVNPEFLRPDPNAEVLRWSPTDDWKYEGDQYQSIIVTDGQS